mmetsp:Transcript_6089/g.20664  ORF Transcript_6089/g.20664 Transcript_6089/m.20664 type:complete len:210 (-) Transcript_6089:422-1051(-)
MRRLSTTSRRMTRTWRSCVTVSPSIKRMTHGRKSVSSRVFCGASASSKSDAADDALESGVVRRDSGPAGDDDREEEKDLSIDDDVFNGGGRLNARARERRGGEPRRSSSSPDEPTSSRYASFTYVTPCVMVARVARAGWIQRRWVKASRTRAQKCASRVVDRASRAGDCSSSTKSKKVTDVGFLLARAREHPTTASPSSSAPTRANAKR